jgi:hypothetical protein
MKRLYHSLSVIVLCFSTTLPTIAQDYVSKTFEYVKKTPDNVYFLPGDTLVWQYTSPFDSTIKLWDFSNPELPLELSTHNLPSSVPGKIINDYYITVNEDGVLTLYDASNLNNISELSSIELDLSFTTVRNFDFEVITKINGDYLYVTGANENPVLKGLQIIDISDPSNITFAIDINDKYNSSPAGFVEFVSDFIFKDNVLFILEQNFLATYNVEDPANFENGAVWEFDENFESISHITFNDSSLFLMAGDYSTSSNIPTPYLYSIDINNPLESLEQKHYFNFGDNNRLLSKELMLRGEYLYFASEQRNANMSGISCIQTRYFDDRTGNVTVRQATGDTLDFHTFNINHDTTFAVGLTGETTSQVKNISSFQIPVDPGLSVGTSAATPGPFYRVFANETVDFLYDDGNKGALVSNNHVQLFDMTDLSSPIPAAPILPTPDPYQDSFTDQWYPTQLVFKSGVMQGNTLYIAGTFTSDEDRNQGRYVSDTLLVYDISNINNPELIETAPWISYLELKKELIYKNRLFDPRSKSFYNIENITNPVVEWDNPDGLNFGSNEAIITSRGLMITSALKFYQLKINGSGNIEVEVLNETFSIEDLPFSANISTFAYQQDKLYVSASGRSSAYLVTIDISNIQEPEVVQFKTTSKNHSVLSASGDSFVYSLSEYDSDQNYRQLTIFESTTDENDQFSLQPVDSIMNAEFGTLKWLPGGNVYNLGRNHLFVYSNSSDTSKVYAGIKEELRNNPVSFQLDPAYPNPFNPSVTIPFTIDQHASVKLTIYNSLGQKVATLLENEYAAGSYKHQWNPNQIASGMYFIEMQLLNDSGDLVESAYRKVVYLK